MHTRIIFNDLINILEFHKKINNDVYSFQETVIDNIICLIEVHFKKKIIVFKSKNIFALHNEELNYKSKYIVYHSNYNNIKQIPYILHNVISNFSFFDGELISKDMKNKIVVENKFFKIDLDNCSICYKPTNEITYCDHSICLQCRENMILNEQHNCPICRKNNIISYYFNKHKECYNTRHDELNQIINYEITNNINLNEYVNQDILLNTELFELLIVREVIHYNILYPILISLYVTNKLYMLRYYLFIIFGSSGLIYYYLKDKFIANSEYLDIGSYNDDII
jgi:hypothetical protein